MKAQYSVVTSAAVAFTGAQTKTILGVKSGAAFGLDLRKFSVSLDGVTASAVPGLVEVVYATFATNAPGTNSTPRTPAQASGRTLASGVTAASAWTAEPTVLTVLEEHLLTPNGGLFVVEYAPDKGYDTALGEGLALRFTSTATVNIRATLVWERC